jgi:hypothetical protein
VHERLHPALRAHSKLVWKQRVIDALWVDEFEQAACCDAVTVEGVTAMVRGEPSGLGSAANLQARDK